jgi:membrane fusion protein (multidrug efflux system)
MTSQMKRANKRKRLITPLAVLLGAGLAAWAFGPDAWRDATFARLGVTPEPRERPPAAVRVATARTESLEETAVATGSLRAREAVVIAPEVSGHVATIHFEQGERVTAGELLVELVDEESRARLALAEATLREARLDLDRARELTTGQGIAAAEVDRLEAAYEVAGAQRDLAKARLAKYRMHAPFDGRVGLSETSIGALVTPQTPIATLYGTDPMELRFALPTRVLGMLRDGLAVNARSNALGDETFRGRIIRIAPDVDRQTRQIRVEAELPNGDGRLRPGMFMEVSVILRQRDDAVVVPHEALLRRGGERFVFVVDDEGRVSRRRVDTGVTRRGIVEIRDHIAAGDRVVTGGLQRVSDGEQVRVVDSDKPVEPVDDSGPDPRGDDTG